MGINSPASVETKGQPGPQGTVQFDTAEEETEPGDPAPRDELTLDVTFELLKNCRRRLALRYLDDNPSTTLSTLAEHIAAEENSKAVRELSSAERKRVYISLYQCHLPKLHDAGVVEFDSNRGTVVRKPPADHFAPYLAEVSGPESHARGKTWPLYYLSLALVGAGLLTLQLLIVPSIVAATAVATAVIASVAGLALFHARHPSTPAA